MANIEDPGTVLTKKGISLISKILASEAKLKITRVAVGTGNVPEGIALKDMTDLIAYKMDGMISGIVGIPEANQVNVTFQVNSIGVSETFVITEAGIYAEDPDDGEILYAYLDLTEDPQLVYNAQNAISKMVEITMAVIVSDIGDVVAEINPQSLISREEMENIMGDLKKVNIGPAEAEIENNTIHLIDRAKKIRDLIFKKKDGTAETYEIAVKAENVETDVNHLFVTNAEKQAISNPQDNTITFAQATTRINIESGLSLGTIFGRIMKWFADMGTAAFCAIANNDTTTAAGYAADARIVRTHGIEIDNIATDMGGLKFSYEGGKFYVQAGADTGSKKQLGSGEVLFSDLKLQFAGGRTSATSATDSTRRSAVFSMAVDVTDHDVLYIGNYTVDRSSSHADGKPDYAIVCQIDGVEYTLDPNGTSIDVSGKSKVNLSLSFSSDMGTYYSVSGTITVSEISLS